MKLSALSIPGTSLTSSIYQTFCLFLWIGGVFLLPITSLPLLIDLSGATTVAPPSAIFFLLLAMFWMGPYVLRKERLPLESIPLIWFVVVCLIAAAGAVYLNIPPWRDGSFLLESAEAILTLAVGAVIFFVTCTWLSTRRSYLLLTLRVINWSGFLVLAWSLFQAYYAFSQNSIYPVWLINFQKEFVGRSMPFFPYRVAGFAYEPSWLAHQLNLVYLPVWLAATVTGFTVHVRRLWKFSFENFLLLGGIAVLFLSFSRVGWVSMMLVAIYLALLANRRLISTIRGKLLSRSNYRPPLRFTIRYLLPAGMWLLSLGVYAALVVGLVYGGARVEPRLGRIVQENLLAANSFYEVTNKLQFAERVLYWATGWEIFGNHPVLGVGPGNVGFFFYSEMPAFGWALTEVADTFYRFGFLPNTKSMWVRILAETGLIGFSIFMSWYYLLWHSGRLARASQDKLLRFVGLTGQLVLIAFLIEGFSVDSFALPYLWFALGLLAAAAALVRKQFQQVPEMGLT